MLSLAQSGRLVLRRQSGRAVEPYFSALETSKKHKSLKYLAPKTISGQVFGAGARTDFENPKVPPPGGLAGKVNISIVADELAAHPPRQTSARRLFKGGWADRTTGRF